MNKNKKHLIIKVYLVVIFYLTCGLCVGQEKRLMVNLGHTSTIHSACFSPDGRYIASGSNDKTIRLWEAKTGKLIHSFKGHTSAVTSVDFSSDGNYIVSGSWDRTVKLWEVKTKELIHSFKGHTADVLTVSISPDGKYIASGSKDMTVKLWDVKNKSFIQSFNNHDPEGTYRPSDEYAGITYICFSPDGEYMASKSANKTIIWNTKAKSVKYILKEGGVHNRHTMGYFKNYICFSPNGKYMVSGHHDMLKVREVATGQLIRSITGHTTVSSVHFSPNGKYIASSHYDNRINIWEVNTGKLSQSIQDSTGRIYSVKFAPDGQSVLSLYDLKQGHTFRIFHPYFHEGFSGIITTDLSNSSMKLWKMNMNKYSRSFHTHSSAVYALSISPDGQYIASGGDDHVIKIWDTKIGQPIQLLRGHSSYIYSLAFSPNDHYLVSSGEDKLIKIWNVKTGTLVQSLSGHTELISSVNFSPDGQYIVSGSDDNSIRVWEVKTGLMVHSFQDISLGFSGSATVNTVNFSPNGKFIILGDSENIVKLWELETGNVVRIFDQHTEFVSSTCFSQDGQYIISGSADNSIAICETVTGKLIRKLSTTPSYVYKLLCSPSNTIISLNTVNQLNKWWSSIQLWNLATGVLINTIAEYDSYAFSIALSPQDKFIASGHWDGSIKLWQPVTGELLITLNIIDSTTWLAITPDSYYDGSPEGIALLHYSDGINSSPLHHSKNIYYKKGLLATIYQQQQQQINWNNGKNIKPDSTIVNPPILEWNTSLPLTTNSSDLTIEVDINTETPLIVYQVEVNGELILSGRHISFLTQEIQLEEGDNHIKVTAVNEAALSTLETSVYYNTVQTNYALIIANEQYQDNDVLKRLPNVHKAGEHLTSLLVNKYNFNQENVRMLHNATKAEIHQAIKSYHNHTFNPYDQLFIYFAGHGAMDETTVAYLAPSDAKGNDYESYIRHSRLEEDISNLPCQNIFFFFDACYSGRFGRDFNAALVAGGPKGKHLHIKSSPEKIIKERLAKKSRLCLASGKVETPAGHDGRYSPFTELLFQALENEKLTKGVIVSFYALFKAVQEARLNPSPKARTFEGHVSGGSFLFIRE